MHIPDGFLPPSVSIIGYAVTGGATWYSLRQINKDKSPQEKIPKASLLTAAFFVASLIHIPLGFSSIHLVLNGLVGVLLGYYAFPAITIGLFFQAVMFQHGGLSTLGVNAAMMGIPALLAYHLFRLGKSQESRFNFRTKLFAFFAGAGALATSAAIFTVVTITTITPDLNAETEQKAIFVALGGYAIQAVIEGVFTVMLVSFLERVKPELLSNN
ncbi:cobalt transporter CbiM [Oscillatoria salina]|uniref:cobalt transporter CbiM n=1 Tax=Oscillatoria salina TaxID=331517 RepID=UPI0013BAB8B6|nr:cobalt transporter CbiM [Oscillatoria salina]MBZ8180091.1 cobalt transporter CbiM [Oscillatoria salina IIICB1]NET89314.1 cobalt transporter CbiM [Kamptonema sp. SIO1D9]